MTPDEMLLSAIDYGNLDVGKKTIEYALSIGADVNVEDHWGRTPLMYAALRGREEIIRILLAAGAKTNIVIDGWTALMYAILDNQVGSVLLLVMAGADVNVRDKHGQTPLHNVRSVAIARILIDAGADMEALNAEGETPAEWLKALTYVDIANYIDRCLVEQKSRKAEQEITLLGLYDIPGRL